MISSQPIFEIRWKRTVSMSGIIKAPFHPLILCPTAFFLDVCNRHIIYLSWGQGELLRPVSKPSRRSKFPKENQVSLQIQHKNCSFSNRSTRAANAGKHPQTSKDSLPRYPTGCVFGEAECKLITQDVLWWSKINPLADSFSLCSQSHHKQANDAPSPGLGSDKPSFLPRLSSFSSHQTSSVRTEIDLPRGCWREVLLRDLLPVWPRGMQTLCSVQVCEPFLNFTLLFIERRIKARQDLALHQSRISPAECKCYKQRRGINLLCCLYCHSLFLAAGAESSLRPIPSVETEVPGVNHLVNSSSSVPDTRVCHQGDSLISCLGRLVLLLETDSN